MPRRERSYSVAPGAQGQHAAQVSAGNRRWMASAVRSG